MFRIVKLGTTEKLIIAITTSRFSSGAKYTASSITATFYKVNDAGAALEIDTTIGVSGVVTLSADTGSKTGFHTALLDVSALTAKVYCVVIEATVDSVAAISHEFLDIDAERKKIADYLTAAPPTVSQIDTQLSNAHGAGAWGGTLGSGVNTIVLTVYETGTTTPIAEYEVTFYNSDLSVCYGTLETNTVGTLTTNLDDGTYKLKGHKLGFNAGTAVETFAVDSTHLTKTIYATAVTEPGTGEWQTGNW